MNNVASETISLNVDYIRARVSGLLGDIQERSAEIEAARRLPTDLVTALKRAGVFRMPVALRRKLGDSNPGSPRVTGQ